MSGVITLQIHPSEISTCLEQAETKGKHLYKQNNNYRNIANVMENPEFREFFDTHFSTWDNTKVILMFMKLYKDIEKASPVNLNGYQKISMIDMLMKDKNLRRRLCEQVCEQSNEQLYENPMTLLNY
jgi:hypothetical protein